MTQPALDGFLGKPGPTFQTRYGKWIVLVLGIALLAVFAMKLLSPKAAVAYVTVPIKRGDLAVSVTAVGNLSPTNQIAVGSQTSGLITRVLVDVNDRVGKNQPVALIDPRRLEDAIRGSSAQLAAQRASVVQAQATVAESSAQLARLREVYGLSAGRVPSKTELAAAEAAAARAVAAMRAAQAQVRAAEAQVSSDQTQRGYAVIRSPVSGVVLSRQVDPGQTVAASFSTPTLFTIAEDLSRMKLDVAIDEADVGQVSAGQRATFNVDAFPGRIFPATVRRVNLGATGNSGSSSATGTSAPRVVSYTASLAVANADLTLRPGMTATATISVKESKASLLVPNAALRFQPDAGRPKPRAGILQMRPPARGEEDRAIGAGSRQLLYLVAADGRLQPVSVVTGATDGRRTVVNGERLRPGLQVVTGRKVTRS